VKYFAPMVKNMQPTFESSCRGRSWWKLCTYFYRKW